MKSSLSSQVLINKDESLDIYTTALNLCGYILSKTHCFIRVILLSNLSRSILSDVRFDFLSDFSYSDHMKRFFLIGAVFVVVFLGVFIVLSKSQKTFVLIKPASSYIFQTFVRGDVCAYRFGSDPNVLDPRCRYWILDSTSKTLSELPVGHPYFQEVYKKQRRSSELDEKQIGAGVCSETENESICTIEASQDDENKFIRTRGPKYAKAESVWIKTLDPDQEGKIIDSVGSIGCEGSISSWSDRTGEILFSSQWEGTPQSPSGEKLKSICIYNYKKNTVEYKKTLPVDMYDVYTADMIQGRIFLPDNLIIDFRNKQEETLPIVENSYILPDGSGILFRNNYIIAVKANPDSFWIHPFDLKTKKWLQTVSMRRVSGVDEANPPQSDVLYFISLSKDGKHLIVEDMPSNGENSPSISSCFYEVNLNEATIQKLVCGYQFQDLYPDKKVSEFDQFIYGEFLDWFDT